MPISSDPIWSVRTRGLCKSYHPRRASLRRQASDCVWALQDINLDVFRGQCVALYGGNGAGKSTLLRILSRITEPTAGEAWVQGPVGSILGVEAGFHGELDGEENIYLNAAILGMPRRLVRSMFDEIVDFAEVSEFLKTPVKYYSDGTRIRLAVSVALHLDLALLLVDEMISATDFAFQEKVLEKAKRFNQRGGTVLLVTHEWPLVVRYCDEVIWLDSGRLKYRGEVSAAVRTTPRPL